MTKTDAQQDVLRARLAELPEDFAYFADVYESDLRPVLEAREAERKNALDSAKKNSVIGIAIVAIAAVIGFGVIKVGAVGIIGIIIGFIVAGWGYPKVNEIAKQTKEFLITPIAERLGLSYNSGASLKAEELLIQSRELKVVPGWDRKEVSDEFVGERNGVPFEFFKAHLEEKRTTRTSNGRTQTTWVTVFRGQCWVIEAPKTFHGTTRVSRDSGWFNALGAIGNRFSRAKLEDPVFEKAFEVYTTDQVESRYLLTPDVMETFLELERQFKGGKFRATFDGNRIYAAIEGGDLFEGGGMFSRIDDPERVGDLLTDIATVFHLVDVLGKK